MARQMSNEELDILIFIARRRTVLRRPIVITELCTRLAFDADTVRQQLKWMVRTGLLVWRDDKVDLAPRGKALWLELDRFVRAIEQLAAREVEYHSEESPDTYPPQSFWRAVGDVCEIVMGQQWRRDARAEREGRA